MSAVPAAASPNDENKGTPVNFLRAVAAIALIVVSAVAVHAESIVHRTAVPAGEAVATGGTFSITFPVSFADAEVRTEDPPAPTQVTHLLTGHDPEGLRVSAMEITGIDHPPPIDAVMEGAANARPGTTVSDVSRAEKDGMTTLSFALTDPKGGSFFRVIRTPRAQYLLVVQFPETIRARAAPIRDGYFASFKLTRP
jgi:hypothetical protein